MIITTTPSVDGYRITQYFPPVSASVVAATGLITDIVAGLSDTFGGRSGAYQEALAHLHQDAMRELSEKSARSGANAAVGAAFDFSQISGKGMQMLMLNAVVTPVTIRTEAEITERVAAEALIADARRAEAESRSRAWADRAQVGSTLRALLEDQETVETAARVLTMYGKRICSDFLERRASELGLGPLDLKPEDIPDAL